MKTILKLSLVIICSTWIKVNGQLADSVSYFINGQEEWFYQQPDILSFRLGDKSQYTGTFSSNIVDKVDYFGGGDGVHNICFNASATMAHKQSVYNIVANISNFEKFFAVPTKAEYVNEPYGKHYWMGTDMYINIIFDDPNISLANAQAFATAYGTHIVFVPPSSIPHATYVLEIQRDHDYLDYLSPQASLELSKEMWENDSSTIYKLAPSLRLFEPHVPDDSLYSELWWAHGNSTQNCNATGTTDPNAHIDLECAWNFNHEINDGPSYSGKGVVVGVIDFDGVQYSHPDCNNMYLKGMSATSGSPPFDIISDYYSPNQASFHAHLQNVSGIIGARRNNTLGGSGVAPQCNVTPSIFNGSTAGWNSILLKLLDKEKTEQVDIINMSFGYLGMSSEEAKSFPFYQALENCYIHGRTDYTGNNPKGIVFVASMGNANSNTFPMPANLPFVLSVGATNPQDQRKSSGDGYDDTTTYYFLGTPYTSQWGGNYNTFMDVSAPGICIQSTDHTSNFDNGTYGASGYSNGDYNLFSGTSAAAPIVSGIAALILEKDSMLTVSQVYEAIRLSCDKVGGYAYSNPSANGKCLELGFGRVNACSALNILDQLGTEEYSPISSIVISHQNPVKITLLLTIEGTTRYSASIFNVNGQLMFNAENVEESILSIDINKYSKGIYIVKIIDNETGTKQTSKIVIE